jgi:uroporphyrinogen-III decarboxylase
MTGAAMPICSWLSPTKSSSSELCRVYKYLKEHGVIIMHHADSFMEQIIEDMVELGIDIWQGVLPRNDIKRLQTQLAGRMTLMGGIDSAIVDRPDSTEEEIRDHVREVCETFAPAGHFIPCITYGVPGTIYPQADRVINDKSTATTRLLQREKKKEGIGTIRCV